MDRLALVGFMASGKSTVGQRLAIMLGRPFLDLDQRIEAEAQRTIAEIFEREGEPAFREHEAGALRRVLAEPPCVLATGGGTVVESESRALLRAHARVVWLDLRFDTIRSRLGAQRRVQRPLVSALSESELIELYRSRRVSYAAAAHLKVEADQRSPVQLARWILGALEDLPGDVARTAP